MRPVALCVAGWLCLFTASQSAAALPVPRAHSFDLRDVTLGPGPFRDAMNRDCVYVLSLDPDRLLHTFRLNVGLPSTAKPYGGWEAPNVELRGHTLGHYLTACALLYRATGDAAFQQRIDTIVRGLAECQAAAPKAGFNPGYLSAFPESFIDRVEARQEVWAPWYTLHKIMAGLLDSRQLAGNAPALEVLQRMTSWVKFRVDRLSPEQMQGSLQMEHGGMTEVLANLYAATRDPDHLRLAQAFEHAKITDPLARGEDQLDGLHANTQTPKAIGAARLYDLTGDARHRTVASTFWERVALHRSYVIGGHSDREHFFPPTEFPRHLSPETTETCNTYNMLKLTQRLHAWSADARLFDFYERGLYNHILASQDPGQGAFVYLMSLEPGHFKTYSTPEHSFWCCVGSGMENHAKYGEAVFAHGADALYVNLFIPAEVQWRDRGVRLVQETSFPHEDQTRLTVRCAQPSEFTLQIRRPGWATGAFSISINGEPSPLPPGAASSAYVPLRRVWRDGDRVQVRLPLALRTESLPGDPRTVAFLYGPIVLAGKLGVEGMPNPYARNQLDQARFPRPPVPVLVGDAADLAPRVERVSGSSLVFQTRGLAQPGDVTLVPFHTLHHERYTVYWRVVTPDAWTRAQAGIAATESEWKDLAAAAIDRVHVGESVSEAAHGFTGAKTTAGALGERTWRQAHHAGHFGYQLKTGGNAQPRTLLCLVGSRDKARKFTIKVGDHTLTPTPLPADVAAEHVIQRYPVPAEALRGRDTLTVTFQADNTWDAATATVYELALQ